MRLFFAILFSDTLRREIAAVQSVLKSHAVRGSFSRPDNLHLTLSFLGETPPCALPVLRTCMQKAASGEKAFSLSFERLGRFRRREGDLVFWSLDASPALLSLQARLQDALLQHNIPFDDKPFRPHLTLGRRVCFEEGFSYSSYPLPSLEATVTSFSLMESKRLDGRLTYVPLHRISLAASTL